MGKIFKILSKMCPALFKCIMKTLEHKHLTASTVSSQSIYILLLLALVEYFSNEFIAELEHMLLASLCFDSTYVNYPNAIIFIVHIFYIGLNTGLGRYSVRERENAYDKKALHSRKFYSFFRKSPFSQKKKKI